MRSQKLGKRAARAGVDFEKSEEDGTELDLYAAIESALNRVKQADQKEEDASGEIGELLFLCSNLARRLDCDAEECLADSCNSFVKRFEDLEKHSADITEVSAEELYSYKGN